MSFLATPEETEMKPKFVKKDSGQAGMTEIWNCGRDLWRL
jgi:hypothetical protein